MVEGGGDFENPTFDDNVVTRFLSTQFLVIVYKSAVVYFMLFAINTGLFFKMQICHLSRS